MSRRDPVARLLPLAVALVTLLPFARGLGSGGVFYFRDLGRQFFPFRRFAVEGLARGEFRYWNPYVHEGEPLPLAPVSYLPDLLQLVVPDERGFSWLLALHVPAAALAFLALARSGIGLGLRAACGGAVAYALGGFCLSTLNLYVYLQAMAWAPLVVLGLIASTRVGPRAWAAAACAVALALSTTGVEIVAQAVMFGLVLGASARPLRWWAAGVGLGLGIGLAAVPIALVYDVVAESARGGGFPVEAVLGHSLHPFALLQVLIGGLFGDPSDVLNRSWGGRFFQGSPYFLSLYLGPTVLALAVVGLRFGPKPRGRLALLALLGVALCLGSWVGAEYVVRAVPALGALRFPVKAFFTVHLATCLLAAIGLQSLVDKSDRQGWLWARFWALSLGGVLAALPLAPSMLPPLWSRFLAFMFPPFVPDAIKLEQGRLVLDDASAGGLIALALGGVAVLVLAGRLRRSAAVLLAGGLIGADLLRAGAGLNPVVPQPFLRPSEQTAAVAAELRTAGGRVFTCEPESTAAYMRARLARARRHDPWSTAVLVDTLAPNYNVPAALPTALSHDFTMLAPAGRVLPREGPCPAMFGSRVAELQRAGVLHVLSLDPIENAALRPLGAFVPRRIEPLAIHVYRLEGASALRFVASAVRVANAREAAESLAAEPGFRESGGVVIEGPGPEATGASGRVTSARERPGHIELEVEADRPTAVVVREGHARGWTARVNGASALALRADGRHLAVRIPAGSSRVVLDYRPPHLTAGLIVMALALVAVCLLWRAGSRASALDAPGSA